MLNTVALQGRLAKDPELRKAPNGLSVTSFTIASDRSYVKAGQERKTDWIDCVAWRETADFVCKYFKKGQMIVIDGTLQTRTYTDKNDNRSHKAYEVIVNHVYFTTKAKEEHDEFSQVTPYEENFSQISDDEDLPF